MRGTMVRDLLLLLGLVATCSAAFSCHLREINSCGASLAAFARRTVGPKNYEAELQYKCEAVKDVHYCIGNYTRDCMTDMQIEMYDFVTEPMTRLHQRFCTEDSDMKAGFFEHAPCLEAAMQKGKFRTCIKDAKVGFEVILNAKYTKRPNIKCCTFNRFMTCFENVIQDQCGAKTLDFVQSLNQMMGIRIPGIYCSGIDSDGPECEALPPSGSPLLGSKGRSPYKILSGLLYASEF